MADETPRYQHRVRVQTPVGDKSRTKPSFKLDTDVNAIMRKYLTTGLATHVARTAPRYGDFTNSNDFMECQNKILDAQKRFMELPAHVRSYVDNDPAKLLDLVYNPEREEEVRKLGLIPPKEVAPDDPKNTPEPNPT